MPNVNFDYSKLKGRIYEVFGTQKKFEEAMNMNHTTLWSKLTNKTYFNQEEILQAAGLLGIEKGSESAYFFTPRL